MKARLSRRLDALERAQQTAPRARLEFWTLAEWGTFTETGQRPTRDTSAPVAPPVVMVWGNRLMLVSYMDLREL